MARDLLKRPSVLVGAWICVVVGVFVWRGDLAVGEAASNARAARLSRQPEIVRAPTASAPPPVATAPRKGRVYDALGYLIVGAEVVPMEKPPTRTDGDGAFTVDLGGTLVTDLLVRADGHRPRWLRTSSASPDVLALQLVPAAPWDTMPAPPAPLSQLRGEGVVRTADGKPLARAFVTALGTGVWARTDDIGRFTVLLPTPNAQLFAHEPFGGVGEAGFVGVSASLVPERTRGAVPLPEVVAAPALAIRGIVRDARGQPVVGVPVEVEGGPLRRVVDTGAGGAFRCGGLVPGQYQVQPFAHRGGLGVRRDVALVDASLDVDLHLVAAEETRVHVVDERGGAVSGVYVASSVGGARLGVARADTDGYAAVPLAPAAATDFDVRTATDLARVTVRRFEEPATLVVAVP